ncbi:preprotein translocase subunit YajC [Roseiconus lacunae]|uniref:preprotein translocase subunit YajC n=1 Tax=Roseiconus lacunae TaxID=2605694 RepID=UPI001E49BF1F|nr:preprotein translocase subunit YajC [Roseiconus lacunae]MCD0462035.1 preprotein translocase subunit YajC [Roseiconus lacunae]
MKISRYSALVFLSLTMSACVNAHATDKPLPDTLLGFLEPGMRVATQYIEGTGDVKISVYDDAEYKVALDIAKENGSFLDAETLASKHQLVRRLLDDHLAKHDEQISAAARDDIRVYPLLRWHFGKIRRIGDDFVLIETEDKHRIVYSRSAITRIYLDSNPITFTTARKRNR